MNASQSGEQHGPERHVPLHAEHHLHARARHGLNKHAPDIRLRIRGLGRRKNLVAGSPHRFRPGYVQGHAAHIALVRQVRRLDFQGQRRIRLACNSGGL